MKFLKDKSVIELIINKSRFIGVLLPVSSSSEISELISFLKKEYPKATHYCYAAITGEQGEYHNSSDDGEPSGTAGIPILNVLKHNEVTNILCVVIRYFGGIKLGSGGLIRAYGSAASMSISNALFYIKKKVSLHRISFSYHLIDKIDQLLKDKSTVVKKEFLNDVSYELYFDNKEVLDDINHLLLSNEHLGELVLSIDI